MGFLCNYVSMPFFLDCLLDELLIFNYFVCGQRALIWCKVSLFCSLSVWSLTAVLTQRERQRAAQPKQPKTSGLQDNEFIIFATSDAPNGPGVVQNEHPPLRWNGGGMAEWLSFHAKATQKALAC